MDTYQNRVDLYSESLNYKQQPFLGRVLIFISDDGHVHLDRKEYNGVSCLILVLLFNVIFLGSDLTSLLVFTEFWLAYYFKYWIVFTPYFLLSLSIVLVTSNFCHKTVILNFIHWIALDFILFGGNLGRTPPPSDLYHSRVI